MATPYEKVYKRFLNSIQDFNLPELDDVTFENMLLEWLSSAIVKSRKCDSDLSLRDDEAQEFEEDLTDTEIEILALGMKLEWVSQYLNSTELTQQFIGGKEEKFYSQSSHIAQLRELRDDVVRQMNSLHNYHTYTNNEYFNE